MNTTKRFFTSFIALLMCISMYSCNDTADTGENDLDDPDVVESNNSPDESDESIADTDESDSESESEDETVKELTPEEIAELSDKEYFADYFVPVVRFVAATDQHYDGSNEGKAEHIGRIFDDMYEYSANHESYNNLDAVFFLGDTVTPGTVEIYEDFFGIVDEHVREETTVRVILGNHEFDNTPDAVENLLQVSGYDSPDAHLEINGYHFLLLSTSKDTNGKDYNNVQRYWLRNKLKEADESDPTESKPIFVIQHMPVSGTIYDSAWARDSLRPILTGYHQVIDLSGHSHYPVNDPRSFWQGSYSAFGCGTMSFYEMDIIGSEGDGVFPTDNEGGWTKYNDGSHNGSHFLLVEVDANNAVKIQAYDLFSGEFIMDPILLRSVASTDDFIYTSERKAQSQKPYFPEDMKFEITESTPSSVKISFTQAECDEGDIIQHYRCFLKKDGKIIARNFVLGVYYFFPIPETVSTNFSGLEAGSEYELAIVAVNSWGKVSKQLVYTFTTPEA
ncbi:MAG: hypothetical protein E7672_00245 [Ruminococcaceae bacterium]|nr:hypothetical protein [Oscillospiraceae bacterium]